MKNIVRECLSLLCVSCGASAATLKFFPGDGCESEPLVEMTGIAGEETGNELGLRESSVFLGGFGPWRMEGGGYGSEWRLLRRIGGMTLSLDLEMNERAPLFVPRRLSAAGELLGLLDHLVTRVEVPAGKSDAPECAACGIRGFDPPIAGISPSIASLR